MNEWQRMFFKEQFKNAKAIPSARRYHPDVIRWAIELYAKSPSAYQQLRTTGVLVLPSTKTLQQYRNFGSSSPGINELAVAEMKKLKSTIDGYITVDEMKVKENLVIQNGKLLGFIDFGERMFDAKLATHICVFYARSLKKELSLPLSWWPTTVTPSFQLASLFWEAVGICETNNFHVHAVVADGCSVNRKFFDLIHGSKYLPSQKYTAPNPYHSTDDILICCDTSHLLKTSRNAVYSSKPGGTKYLCKSGEDILWPHIKTLYELESSKPLHKTKLSPAHMDLHSYSKMKVSLAKDTLSWAVATALKQDVAKSEGTSTFIFKLDKWFEIVNCGVKNAIKSPDDERLSWLQKHFIQYLLDWRNEVDVIYPGEEKRIISRSTWEGLLFSTQNLIALTNRLLLNNFQYVCLGMVTQDVLEAVFGNLRSIMRRNTNPDIKQIGYGLSNISQRKIIKKIKGGNTTFGKSNVWTSVCEEPLSKKIKNK
uniref:Uncharacterized protein LOC101242444 n=1 Tax=Phallusia mammillata TaxID=59560 RepID=A0A6F9DIX4_9ASCI|nr:uncharacterized protein LOC101242444 [Phallusia mammillata]